MSARPVLLLVVGTLMSLAGQALEVDAQSNDTPQRLKSEASQEMPTCSSGEYQGQKWRIDKNHLMYWEDEPYVRFGFTGNGDVTRMFEAGFRQFTLMPDENWPIAGPDPKYVQAVNDTSDRLERAGATYYGTLNALWPWRYGDLIAESDKAAVFVRDVRDVTECAGQQTTLDFEVRLPIPQAEQKRVKARRVHAVLIDLEHATREDLSGQVESLTPVMREPAEGREGDGEREG